MEHLTWEWRCFLETARRGSFSRAAEQLQLPQQHTTLPIQQQRPAMVPMQQHPLQPAPVHTQQQPSATVHTQQQQPATVPLQQLYPGQAYTQAANAAWLARMAGLPA